MLPMPLFDPPLAPLGSICLPDTGSGTTQVGLSVQTTIGKLPSNLPLSLPVQNGASVVAGVTYSVDGATALIDVSINVNGSPSAARRYYRRQFKKLGWARLPTTTTGGTSGGTGPVFRGDVYCGPQPGPWLGLWSGRDPSVLGPGVSAVWIVVHMPNSTGGGAGPCGGGTAASGATGTALSPALNLDSLEPMLAGR